MNVTSNKRITALPSTSPIPTDVPSPTGNTHSMINSNTSGMVPLNRSPLRMMDVNKSPLENGKILEQVKEKISCISMVPMKRVIKIDLVCHFTKSADLECKIAHTVKINYTSFSKKPLNCL